eukprot:TRINITY_DN8425_c0_g2_i1.p1 TRINITY_DN8425_c0_g2~~TRINITY_DN8425_c0_g2_i1.p1  ORF type:complete len:460 (+),score=94.74 TRINITY_DN8425_c0_g2_i1:184-1563(+)
MPSELISKLFKRRCDVDADGETWESAPAESSADATAHLNGLPLDAPAAAEWLRKLEDTPEEDTLAEALAEAVAERGELPEHAPGKPSAEDAEKVRILAETLAQMREQFAQEREKLGGEKEELSRREAELAAREKALEQERETLRKQEEAERDYPVPEWLKDKTLKGTINIGVVGNAGVGKSLLINKLRRIRPHADGWAQVGVNETTMEPTMYAFRNVADVRLWDLPGCGTEAFPSKSYIRTMGLRYFDKVVIVTAGRFTSTEVALRAELQEHKVPFCMVRTKVDIDVYNNLQDNGMQEQATLNQIVEDMRSTHAVERPYLVSLRDPQAYDMPALMGDLFPSQRNKLDPFAPSFCPSAPAWNEPWAMPLALSPTVAGLQGRWYDAYGAVYLVQGKEAHVTLREGQAAVVQLVEGQNESLWWTKRWYIDGKSVAKAAYTKELRWTPKNIRHDKPLIWWWSD